MIWPFGNFFQEARSRSLQALSVGVKASLAGWVPLTDWRKYSSISVSASDKNNVEINCNRVELRSSLVGEIEAWADHEMEMRAQVMRALVTGSGSRDSWFIVSTYYWAVFSSCLLLRLLGTPVFRMVSGDLEPFRRLVTPGSSVPNEGAFRLEQLGPASATMEVVRLVRLKSNYHQALWVAAVAALSGIHASTVTSNSNAIENALVKAILKGLGATPSRLSDLRNAVNYRSESGFPASVKGLGFSILADARAIRTLDTTNLLVKLSESADAVKTQGDGVVSAAGARFMFWSAVTLSALSQTLYKEVAPVIRFDRAWCIRRRKFGCSSEFGLPEDMRFWYPVSDAQSK